MTNKSHINSNHYDMSIVQQTTKKEAKNRAHNVQALVAKHRLRLPRPRGHNGSVPNAFLLLVHVRVRLSEMMLGAPIAIIIIEALQTLIRELQNPRFQKLARQS
ncbi:hypothetical protein MTR_5g086800 [Medicago truncatula]|uniref:Uncharacterized protein n=1 Tax=Medicago truncatula TaxID=3880 RepID=G7KHC1_MEDTR|nr:hypothetical protein MTR_5g086800 [Medicago truncatula]